MEFAEEFAGKFNETKSRTGRGEANGSQYRAASSNAFPIELFDTIATESVAKRYLIKGVLARGETSAWIAPPGGMKSALLNEAAVCVAAGNDWRGKKNKGAAGVIYFALERADLVRRRLRAHRERDQLGQLPIALVTSAIDLMNSKTVPRVLATIREAEERMGCAAGLLIFDTFAKLIAAGGGDEDKARDQGAVFANLQRIKDAVDVHAALVGHTGKDETRGARGSNAILGDADVMVKISGDIIRTATVLKANDMAEGPLFSFKTENHEFGTDDDGDPVAVNIVAAEVVQEPAIKSVDPKLTPNQKTLFSILHSAGPAGLTAEEWNEQARDAGIGKNRKADLYDARTGLKAKRLVREYGDRWTVSP